MSDPDSASRRRFLRTAGALASATLWVPLLPGMAATAGKPTAATLTLRTASGGLRVSPQLAGLSYETLQLHDPAFFSRRNEALVVYLKTLNPDGVLRIGGNTSDFAVWSEYRGALPDFPQVPHALYPRPYVITPRQLENLAGFLDATGWQLIFGLNLKFDLPAMAAELAAAVQRATGDHLLACQIGNEPNDFPGSDGKPITFDDYFARWQRTANAVRKRVSVPLAGPDTGANTDWVIAFSQTAHGLAALTRHYYRGGAPQATSTIVQLLGGDPGFIGDVARIHAAGARHDLPFVLSEVNSYWGGGKLGISNTFAAALWGGDFMLACARAGIQSFNFHGGVLAVLEASLGKPAATTLPGASRLQRIDAISGRYTPIAGDAATGYYARPLYYGMLLAQQFAGARFSACELATGGTNLTAYAAERNGQTLLAVFNKDLQRDVVMRVRLDKPAAHACIWRLQAPSVANVHDTRLAGAQVSPDGHWAPDSEHVQPIANNTFHVAIPRASALLVRLAA